MSEAAASFETAAMEPDQCIEAVLIGGIEIQMHPVGSIGDIFGDAHGRTSFLASFGGWRVFRLGWGKILPDSGESMRWSWQG